MKALDSIRIRSTKKNDLSHVDFTPFDWQQLHVLHIQAPAQIVCISLEKKKHTHTKSRRKIFKPQFASSFYLQEVVLQLQSVRDRSQWTLEHARHSQGWSPPSQCH